MCVGGVCAPNHHIAHRSPVYEMSRTSESTRKKLDQWLLTRILSWTKFYAAFELEKSGLVGKELRQAGGHSSPVLNNPPGQPTPLGKGRKSCPRVPGMRKGQGHVWSGELRWLSSLRKHRGTFTQSTHLHPEHPVTQHLPSQSTHLHPENPVAQHLPSQSTPYHRDSFVRGHSFPALGLCSPGGLRPLWHTEVDMGPRLSHPCERTTWATVTAGTRAAEEGS